MLLVVVPGTADWPDSLQFTFAIQREATAADWSRADDLASAAQQYVGAAATVQ